MVLESIQHQIESIYDLNLAYQVNDFLITDQGQADRLENNKNSRETSEKLLVNQSHDDELRLSLYLAEELLRSLDDNNPYDRLNRQNLTAFCTALEGVSHFIYLTWNASHDRPVSQLEIELQAEVDKFVSIVSLLSQQGDPVQIEQLSDWLFRCCSFDPRLDAEQFKRYETANYYASQFCTRLGSHICHSGASNEAYKELRRFYRKRHLDKLNECGSSSEIKGP